MTSRIERLAGQEILDSRGRPTVRATCELASGARGVASVPSGASTGAAEAHELRDADRGRYRGWGCRKAVAHIHGELRDALTGTEIRDQQALDSALVELDGTPDKGRLGANTLLAVSLAFARAVAAERGLPLYRYLAELVRQPLRTLPRLTVNLFSGGKHAGGQVAIQDVLVVPVSARSVDEALATVFDVYQAAMEQVRDRYGMRPLSADEGGLAPPFTDSEAMLADAVDAIVRAGRVPGQEVALAVDLASTQFFADGCYQLDGRSLSGEEMVDLLLDWSERYPLVSIEDGLAQEDWSHWTELLRRGADRFLVLGDDLLCTNPRRIRRAAGKRAANALLLKPNQIGTLSEAAEACLLARSAGWHVTVSARSGETEDDWLADLAVGWGADDLKVGSITQSERLAKYNRLLEIESETGLPLAQPVHRGAAVGIDSTQPAREER